MTLPKHEIVTRKEWRELRDESGGKSGLSKVNLGDALDKFHKAYETAKKKDEPSHIVKSIDELSKAVKTYITEVKKKNTKVAKAAEENIQTPVEVFIKELAAAADEQNKRLNAQVKLIETTAKSVKEMSGKIVKVSNFLDKILNPLSVKYHLRVPPEEIEGLKSSLEGLRSNAEKNFTISQKLKRDTDNTLAELDLAVKEPHRKQIAEISDDIREAMNSANSTIMTFRELEKKAFA